MEYLYVNDQSYEVIKLLGKGKGGYSYLVSSGQDFFVLKQIHHEQCDYYQFGDKLQSEINDYHTLSKLGIRMPKLLQVDKKQERILKEYILGETILQRICQDQMKPEYFDQIHSMCQLLYQNHLNIDYFPTNFIVQDDLLYYIDYECNSYMEQWDFEHWGYQYWSKTEQLQTYLSTR